ncbi:hypothetical protein [Achromobacter denitrificans]|uniref:Phage tail protein n=1 Tax=Achromobacter denitrificans TaxID=32002 RepID=A0A6N0JDK8_ACHDE|nr:hypothetical protein [Achromobacter denitrificans]QKQ45189.1 hypothetical protein FOC81_00055 [Achromobacter denitrificans]QKQ51069.1 hypothetical protein FOC81_31850 [Achromobacter denitrificans]
MTTPHVSTGSLVGVSAALPSAMTRSAFDSLAYTPVRGVRAVSSLGKSYQTVPFHPIGAPVPFQRRVAQAAASLPLDLYRLADPGQDLLRAALDSEISFSFRITVPGFGHHYFTARTSSRMLGIGGGTDIAVTSVALEIDSPVFEPP